ncbi:MAG TPA: sodium-translocating pyrophosphatase [Phycisphaerales bacterium]|nr:sodium-translocating pyrophosphatase [Phycisphaerales bacterium]HMP38193.1 sodium-translocating pyrophosphatase [Phycisphaerales bacterium]
MPEAPLLTLAAIGDIPAAYWLAPIGAIVALVMARVFSKSVMQRSEGDAEMVRIAQAVREGAMAYLRRQYRVVAIVFVGLVIFLGILASLRLQPALTMLGVPVAGILSGLCGWFGMRMATNASARTAQAAKESLNDGLTVAFRSGAVMGLNVVGFALLDASFWFLVLNLVMDASITDLTTIMLSFAMGASTQALFARVGGGIYTKAADVGADLVGKVEAGIPEDDARNPATIADNVGDNVGDVAGMGADLYESYYGSILATMALGAAAAFTIGRLDSAAAEGLAFRLAATPLALAGVGILCSIIGIFTVKATEGASFAQLLKALHKGVYVASALIIVVAFALLWFILGGESDALARAGTSWWRLGLAITAGLVAGNVIAYATEYYTSYEHAPTRRISIQGLTGPATVIIGGIAEGMKSTWASLLTVVVAIIAAFTLAGGGESFLMGLYGVSIAAVGMLATLGITLATDAYGPIADNAGGNAEMTGQPPHVRERTDMLDSLGNTTAATGKGFAIGSAALTALALFAAYVQVVQVQLIRQAETFVQRSSAAVPAELAASPHAVYQGHGRFALVFPGQGETSKRLDCGLLVDRVQIAGQHFDEAVGVGHVFSLRASAETGPAASDPRTARELVVSTRAGHADHMHDYTFEIISARNGTLEDVAHFYGVSLTNPRALGGIFIGVLLAFLFCAMTMDAVGRAAYAMMGECRRQFAKMREAFRAQGMSESDIANPEKWPKRVVHEGVEYPQYAECVSISTAGAQREMIVPSILAILVPIAVGLILGVPGVMGLLAGGLTSGFAVAVFMANAGGAWDNAKKLVESYGRITADKFLDDASVRNRLPAEIRDTIAARAEDLRRAGKGSAYVYGKGSDDHKATVVGDTVGDPFKDTSGPSLNILIKLISIVSVVFAGLVVAYGPIVSSWIGLR